MKRYLSLFLTVMMLVSLCACTKGSDAQTGHIDIFDSYRYADGGVLLPEGAVLSGMNGQGEPPEYRIDDVTALEAYDTAAEQAGYTVERMTYFTLLYRDNEYLFLSLGSGDGNASLTCYCGREPSAGGLSREQARDAIDPDSPLLPIDVSPEGLFEKTGGQIFMLPLYSFDYYRGLYGEDSGVLDCPENKYYLARFCYVRGDEVIALDMPALAFADLDGDGVRETVRLGYGPTSGIFSYTVTAYRGGQVIAVGVFDGQSGWGTLSFAEKDGSLYVRYSEQLSRVALQDAKVILTPDP